MSYAELAQKYRVTAGFVAGLLFLRLSRPTLTLLGLGALVSLAGIALRFWAAGYLQKARKLTTGGPYSYTRNPLYLGSFLLVLGFVIAGGSWVAAAVILFLFAVIYVPTMRREEAELRNGFQEEFYHYAAHVPLFIPRLTPFRITQDPFRLDQVLRNREYSSMVGCAVGLLLIYLKLRLFP